MYLSTQPASEVAKVDALIAISNECAQKGDLPRAIGHLSEALTLAGTDSTRYLILQKLISLNVMGSKHEEAINLAKTLNAEMGIRRVPWIILFPVTYLLGALFVLNRSIAITVAKVFSRIALPRKTQAIVTWDQLRALQFAFFWNNILRCPIYSVLQIAKSRNERELILSVCWLGYSMSYAGHGLLGTFILRRALKLAKQRGLTQVLEENLPLLAIAYQMSGRLKKSYDIHTDFDREHPDAPEFYRLLSITHRVYLSLWEGQLKRLSTYIDVSFSKSFALKESRHHIQLYAAKATLLAIEGKIEESKLLLAKAENSALVSNNPLDYLIYHRFAAIVFYHLGEFDLAESHIIRGAKYCIQYGNPVWYAQELGRVEFAIRRSRGDSFFSLFSSMIKTCFRTAFRLNFYLSFQAIKTSFTTLVNTNYPFFGDLVVVNYLKQTLPQDVSRTNQGAFSKLATQVTDSLSRPFCNTDDQPLETQDLLDKLKETFSSEYAVSGVSISSLLERVREEFSLNSFPLLSDTRSFVGLPCGKDSYFYAIALPTTLEFQESVAVGVKVDLMVDPSSITFIEATLKLVASQFVFLKSIQISRQEHVQKEKLAAIGKLAAQVAHDIRSPLASLNMILPMIREVPENQRSVIRTATMRIQDIANNLLEKHRAPDKVGFNNTNREPRHHEITRQLLPSLIETIISEKRTQYSDRMGLSIEADLCDGSYGIFASVNANDFKTILSNLINNSVEAMGARGEVKVGLTKSDGLAILSVSDTGKGIPENLLSQVMERGVSFDKQGGSGLGLFHARECAKAWGGKVKIESKLGTGTTVLVEIPLAESPPWFVPEIALSLLKRAVVLDDDPSVHQIWQNRLGSKIPVTHFHSASDLIEWFDDEESKGAAPGETLYLCDFELVGQSQTGLQVIRELDIASHAVLVTSRFDEPALLEDCTRLGLRMIPKGMAGFVPVSQSR